MERDRRDRRERLLDPISRISEILFGLIMALTLTTTLSAATAGRDEVRTLIVGVLGCNIAWGLVDAVMFLMSAVTERGHGVVTIRSVQSARNSAEAHRVITNAMSPLMASTLTTDDIERVRQHLLRMRDLPPATSITREDWLRALGVFLLVFLSTLPVVIPFFVVRDAQVATRLSNAIAIVMLFGCGYWLAAHAGYSPWRAGLSMVLLGVFLVAIAIALGG